MSEAIRVNINRLVLRGIDPADRTALVRGLQTELARVLADPATRTSLVRSRQTPVMKLGRIPLESGLAGARKLGTSMARAIGRGLKS